MNGQITLSPEAQAYLSQALSGQNPTGPLTADSSTSFEPRTMPEGEDGTNLLLYGGVAAAAIVGAILLYRNLT